MSCHPPVGGDLEGVANRFGEDEDEQHGVHHEEGVPQEGAADDHAENADAEQAIGPAGRVGRDLALAFVEIGAHLRRVQRCDDDMGDDGDDRQPDDDGNGEREQMALVGVLGGERPSDRHEIPAPEGEIGKKRDPSAFLVEGHANLHVRIS